MAMQPRIQAPTTPLGFLLQAINTANPSLPAALSASNITVGLPAVMPAPASSGINTSLLLVAVAGSGYTESITVYYPRTDIGQSFATAGIVPTLDFTTIASWAELFTALNTRYGTLLSATDTPIAPFVLQTPMTVTIPATSLLYTGTLVVNHVADSLATAVTVTALSGLSTTGLTQAGEALILAMVNAANPTMVNGPVTASNVTLGTVATATGALNSQVTLTAVVGQGYTGAATVTYNRLDIQTGVMATLAPSGATVGNNNFALVSDLIAPLNAAYNLGLVASDLSNGSTAVTLTNGAGTVTLDIAATSLKYIGTLNVTVTQTQMALSAVVTTTALSGFTAP